MQWCNHKRSGPYRSVGNLTHCGCARRYALGVHRRQTRFMLAFDHTASQIDALRGDDAQVRRSDLVLPALDVLEQHAAVGKP
jgi:hypothetical protein